MNYPMLQALLGDLRHAGEGGHGQIATLLRHSARRIRRDPAYAEPLREEVKALLHATRSTHLLTDTAILGEEGLVGGIVRRVAARIAPAPARDNALGAVVEDLIGPQDERWLRVMCTSALREWIGALSGGGGTWEEPSELASAAVVLATRVAAAGYDPRLVERIPSLDEWKSPFLELTRAIDQHTERAVTRRSTISDRHRALAAIRLCATQVAAFREQKKTLGTTLHLSSRSLAMLQQLRRLRLIVEITSGGTLGRAATATLVVDILRGLCRKRPITDFARQKLDLLAWLAIGHAAQKGAHYSASSSAEYTQFLKRSLLGGVLVALFACVKIHLSHEGLPLLVQAVLYGFNYAVCFALIYLMGATLATKQPALTASRLAEALEGGQRGDRFAYLVRSIWRSQFISFVGNIAGAAVVALLLAGTFYGLTGTPFVSPDEAVYLRDKHHLLYSGTLFYAGVAGVMLSAAGFFAGFVDNVVIFHRVADRMKAGTGIFRHLSDARRHALARRIDSSLGALSGNVLLGFMLGSAGTIGIITGLPLDIRHIAFASSHVSLAITHSATPVPITEILGLFAAVLAIGLVNFVVSFGLTLWVAILARRIEGVDWRAQMRALWRLVRSAPLQFFIPRADDVSQEPQ